MLGKNDDQGQALPLRSHQLGGGGNVALGLHAPSSAAEVRSQAAVCTSNDLLKGQSDHSISSECLNNVLIPNHSKLERLSEDISAYLGMRTGYQQDLIYSFLKFLLPQSLPTPTGTACLLSLTPPHRTTEPHNMHSCGKGPACT